MSPALPDLDPYQRKAFILDMLALEREAPLHARADVNEFIEQCIVDEGGRPLRQAPFHRDIQAAFTDHNKVIIFAPPEHGKSIQTAMRLIWEMGRNPSLRVLYVSSTETQGKKILGIIKTNIEKNERIWKVFPGLRRERFSVWSDTVIQRAGSQADTRKDYTLQAIGIGGSILGSRADIAILDDVCDLENSSSATQRRQIIDWYETTLSTRIVRGGKTWIIGTPWHKSDLPHSLEDRGVITLRMPIEDSPASDGSGNYLWPEQWDKERLADCKKTTSSWRHQQQRYMKDQSPEGSPFSLEILERFRVPSQWWGNLEFMPDGWQTITGVDLAIKKKKESDVTSLTTIGTDGMRKRPIDSRAGKWGLMEIRSVCVAVHGKYGSVFVVEDNAAQDYLLQLLKGTTNIRVIASTSRRGTKTSEDWGIPAMAIDIENGRWEFPALPSAPGPVKELFDECVAYSPGSHTGDRLMSCYLAWSGVDRLYRGGITVSVGSTRTAPAQAPKEDEDEDDEGEG